MKYKSGHIEPWWDDSFRRLEYVYSPIKNSYVPHFAGNFGIEPRYTMQITGVQQQ